MPHYKSMFDEKEYLFAFDLQNKEVTVEIAKVEAGTITGEQGRKSKKPLVSFKGAKKKLALNKTNGKTIASLYGNDTSMWIGKLITIYPTTTTFGSETVECIRVRPVAPQPKRGKEAPTALPEPQHDAETGEIVDAQLEEAAVEA